MPENGDLGSIIPKVNRWLAGVEIPMKDATFCGDQEKIGRWNQKRPNIRHSMTCRRHSTGEIPDRNRNFDQLNSGYSPSRFASGCPGTNNQLTYTLPKIKEQPSRQKKLGLNSEKLEVISLEASGEETTPLEVFKESRKMEVDRSQSYVSITEAVSQFSLNMDSDEDFSEDERLKGALCTNRVVSNGLFRSLRAELVPKTLRPTIPNSKTHPGFELKHETISTQVRNIRTCNTSSRYNEETITLPPLISCDHIPNSVLEVPTITVFQERESRPSKVIHQDLSLDPRFLMPTESSVQEARYLLANRRGSFPYLNRMHRRSLDMVREEHSGKSPCTEETFTPTTLTVPRGHRNRSRSLDGSVETKTSFTAFKESLKVRTVKRTTFGT